MWKNVYYFLGDLGCNETKRKLLVFDLQICIIICVTHSIGQCVCVCVCVCVRVRACAHMHVCVNAIHYNTMKMYHIT